jgi:RNA polymerase sigma factor (sigma-70 family)
MNQKKETHSLDEINQILCGVEAMVWSILAGFHKLSHEDKEDLKSEIMIYLHRKILPKYDPTRNAKFSSFAYKCIVNFIKRKLFARKKRRKRQAVVHHTFQEDIDNEERHKALECAQNRVVKLRDAISDGGVLKPKEMVVFFLMDHNPDLTQREIAEIVGYKHPSAISMMMSRMREKLKKFEKYRKI